MSTNFHPKFEEGLYYHVYNRTNNEELLFRNDENFNYFLKKYEYYVKDNIDTIAYCLMPTHFHFLVKVKNNISIGKGHDISDSGYFHNSENRNVMSFSLLIEEQFRKFFISYSKSYNKWNSRHGNLLERPFKRVLLANEKKVIDKICYIHHNPIHHGYCENYNEWKYSTYLEFTSEIKGKMINLENILPQFSKDEWTKVHGEFKENFNIGKNFMNEF